MSTRNMRSLLDQFFVYHPEPWQEWFQAADGARLFGWYAEAQMDCPGILWCHGNTGRIINRLENLRELYRVGLSVFIFNYRGYGRSQGRPSEEGFDRGCVQQHISIKIS